MEWGTNGTRLAVQDAFQTKTAGGFDSRHPIFKFWLICPHTAPSNVFLICVEAMFA